MQTDPTRENAQQTDVAIAKGEVTDQMVAVPGIKAVSGDETATAAKGDEAIPEVVTSLEGIARQGMARIGKGSRRTQSWLVRISQTDQIQVPRPQIQND